MADAPDAHVANPSALRADKIYAELRTSIRETDAISFKLMGLVPLTSATALVALVVGDKAVPLPAACVLSLFAAATTLGLFRWELRNIQTCSWLMAYAQALETTALAEAGIKLDPVFQRRPAAPQLFCFAIGKTESEKILYPVTALAWLAMPLALSRQSAEAVGQLGAQLFYVVPASVILLATLTSVFSKPRLPRAEVTPQSP